IRCATEIGGSAGSPPAWSIVTRESIVTPPIGTSGAGKDLSVLYGRQAAVAIGINGWERPVALPVPLLPKEMEVFPAALFELEPAAYPWGVAHVRSRQEKSLARFLAQRDVPFYLPQLENRRRRSGRDFVSHLPLFPGYVFFRGGAAARDLVWRSNVAASVIDVEDQERLGEELAQLR